MPRMHQRSVSDPPSFGTPELLLGARRSVPVRDVAPGFRTGQPVRVSGAGLPVRERGVTPVVQAAVAVAAGLLVLLGCADAHANRDMLNVPATRATSTTATEPTVPMTTAAVPACVRTVVSGVVTLADRDQTGVRLIIQPPDPWPPAVCVLGEFAESVEVRAGGSWHALAVTGSPQVLVPPGRVIALSSNFAAAIWFDECSADDDEPINALRVRLPNDVTIDVSDLSRTSGEPRRRAAVCAQRTEVPVSNIFSFSGYG